MKKPFIFLCGGGSIITSVMLFSAGLPDVLSKILVSIGAILMICALCLWLFGGKSFNNSPADMVSKTPGRSSPDNKLAGNLDTFALSSVSTDLRKQVDRLSNQIENLSYAANSAELEGRVSSLQKVLVATQVELKIAKSSLTEEKRLHESAESSKVVLRDDNASLLNEQKRLKSELESAVDSLDKLVIAESNRLEQMVPLGLLGSPIGQTVKWCAEATTRGDRVAAQIFASLQSIKAAQGDDELKGLLLSSLQVLGQSIRRFSEREGYSPAQKYDILSNWSSVLNEISASRFTLIVPSIGARLNLNTMVSSGVAGGNVNEVHCWGVMNENRDLHSPALVS